MSKKSDPRTIQTKNRIKQVLLEQMKTMDFNKITVTEICRMSQINRGTFYLHYCDLYAVLDELMDEALREEAEAEPYHCSLSAAHYQCPYGLCDKIHTHPEYGVIFFDDSLRSLVIEKIAAQSKEKYLDSLCAQLSLSREDAEAIFYFQLNGCLAVNKNIYLNGGKNWEHNRDLIGGFIQSGLKRYVP